MNSKECLEKAIEIVCRDREDSFKLISDFWSVYIGVEFSTEDVAVMMALLEIARIATGKHKEDNFVDLAGNAACACEIDGVKGTRKQKREDLNRKPKFRLEDYPGKYVMHCDTERKAEKFCKFLDNQGKRWLNRSDCLVDNNCWTGAKMCYNFQGDVSYSNKEFYEDYGYIILEFDDFDW